MARTLRRALRARRLRLRPLRRKTIHALLVVAGAALVDVAVGLVFVPAAIGLAGLAIGAYGFISLGTVRGTE